MNSKYLKISSPRKLTGIVIPIILSPFHAEGHFTLVVFMAAVSLAQGQSWPNGDFDGRCDQSNNNDHMVNGPFSCNQVFFCTYGVRFVVGEIGLCSGGDHFDNTLQSCVRPSQSDCWINGNPPISEINALCFGMPDGQMVRGQESCSQWYICRHIMKSIVIDEAFCPSGQHFSALRQMCVPEAESDCGKVSTGDDIMPPAPSSVSH